MKNWKITSEVLNRFWSRVDIKDSSECWNWLRLKDKDGYGRICIDSTDVRAHRLSYIIHYGEIPKGLLICHKCNNPSCCNPCHLYAGTPKENMQDCKNSGRLKSYENIRKYQQTHFGEKHPRAKLTENQVLKIKKLLSKGIKQGILAEKFNISRQTISNINVGNGWRHLNDSN